MATRPIKIDLIGDDSQLKKTLKGAGDRIGKFGKSVAKMGVTAVRERIAVIRSFQPQADKIVGHMDLKPTTCPGPEVTRMLRAGMFEPSSGDIPAPQPPYTQTQIDAIKEEMARIYRKVEALEASIQ